MCVCVCVLWISTWYSGDIDPSIWLCLLLSRVLQRYTKLNEPILCVLAVRVAVGEAGDGLKSLSFTPCLPPVGTSPTVSRLPLPNGISDGYRAAAAGTSPAASRSSMDCPRSRRAGSKRLACHPHNSHALSICMVSLYNLVLRFLCDSKMSYSRK